MLRRRDSWEPGDIPRCVCDPREMATAWAIPRPVWLALTFPATWGRDALWRGSCVCLWAPPELAKVQDPKVTEHYVQTPVTLGTRNELAAVSTPCPSVSPDSLGPLFTCLEENEK